MYSMSSKASSVGSDGFLIRWRGYDVYSLMYSVVDSLNPP